MITNRESEYVTEILKAQFIRACPVAFEYNIQPVFLYVKSRNSYFRLSLQHALASLPKKLSLSFQDKTLVHLIYSDSVNSEGCCCLKLKQSAHPVNVIVANFGSSTLQPRSECRRTLSLMQGLQPEQLIDATKDIIHQHHSIIMNRNYCQHCRNFLPDETEKIIIGSVLKGHTIRQISEWLGMTQKKTSYLKMRYLARTGCRNLQELYYRVNHCLYIYD